MTASTPPRPQKRLGQHFLIDPNIVRKIVRLAAFRPGETALEIGPGRGILTRELCETATSVIAVELDRKLEGYLAATLADCHNVDLRYGDALMFPYGTLPQDTVVVANLPYYVSTPLLFKFFEAHARIDRMVLMLQAEVARRMVAKPATSDYGILSVLTQYWTDASVAFRVPATCFRPRPDVDSAVISLVMRPHRLALGVQDETLFVKIVRAAFAHRRKTLANSLRDEHFSPPHVADALAETGIEPSRRAETLTLSEFAALSEGVRRCTDKS